MYIFHKFHICKCTCILPCLINEGGVKCKVHSYACISNSETYYCKHNSFRFLSVHILCFSQIPVLYNYLSVIRSTLTPRVILWIHLNLIHNLKMFHTFLTNHHFGFLLNRRFLRIFFTYIIFKSLISCSAIIFKTFFPVYFYQFYYFIIYFMNFMEMFVAPFKFQSNLNKYF